MSLVGSLIRSFSERSAHSLGYNELAVRLKQSGEKVTRRLSTADDTPANRQQAAHIIGIERWSQRRLRVLLGDPPTGEEYDSYRPGASATLAELSSLFEQTRANSLLLLNELRAAGISKDQTTAHNSLGKLSVGGWMIYLDAHADRESSRVG